MVNWLIVSEQMPEGHGEPWAAVEAMTDVVSSLMCVCEEGVVMRERSEQISHIRAWY